MATYTVVTAEPPCRTNRAENLAMAKIAPMKFKILTRTAPGKLLNQTNYKTGLPKYG